ncbi:MAG: hypothetical protein SOW59_03450 [Corynebacterium sp.]|nr:hypothetical protein [Corynebacterium sp.]
MSVLAGSLIADYKQEIRKFQLAAQGFYLGPAMPLPIVDKAVANADGLKPQELVRHTEAATGKSRPRRGGGLWGVAIDIALGLFGSVANGKLGEFFAAITADYDEDQRDADKVSDSARDCAAALDDIVNTSETTLAEILTVAISMLGGLTGLLIMNPAARAIIPFIVPVGRDLIDGVNSFIVDLCNDRDNAIESCFTEFGRRCEEVCEKKLPPEAPEVAGCNPAKPTPATQPCNTIPSPCKPVDNTEPAGPVPAQPAPTQPATPVQPGLSTTQDDAARSSETKKTDLPTKPCSSAVPPSSSTEPEQPRTEPVRTHKPVIQEESQQVSQQNQECKSATTTPASNSVTETCRERTTTTEIETERDATTIAETDTTAEVEESAESACGCTEAEVVEKGCTGTSGLVGLGIAVLGIGALVVVAQQFIEDFVQHIPPLPDGGSSDIPAPAPEPAPEPVPEPDPVPTMEELKNVPEPTPPPKKMVPAASPGGAALAPNPPVADTVQQAPAAPVSSSSSAGSSIRARKAGQW